MAEPLRIRRAGPKQVQFGKRLTDVLVGIGLPDVDELKDEILHYANVLLGREDSPIESPYLTMQEVATAYHSRAREIEMMIFDAEREGAVAKGSPLYKFRTGSLSSFIELSKRAAELGSRRLTQEELLYRQKLEGPA